MKCSAEDRLIEVYFTVPDLDIIAAIGIGAYPRFVLNRRPLTTEVRQRYQIPLSTFLALR